MMSASKDPEAHREEEKIKRERRMTMAPDELEKIRSEGQTKRKKKRAAIMKLNNEVQDQIHMETDQNYKEASNLIEETQKKEVAAKVEISRDLSQQKSALKLRLQQRKKNALFNRSNSFLDENSSMLKKMPMSTRANSFMPKFGFPIARGMMEEVAYAPNRQETHLNFTKQMSAQNNSMD